MYHFDLGWGNDTLSFYQGFGASGTDVIEFGAGIFAEDIIASRDGLDLLLQHSNGDSITVENFFSGSDYQRGEAHFADGTVLTASDLIFTQTGTGSDDTLSGISAGGGNTWRDVLFGEGGNDTLRGLGGDDFLYGGDGNDDLSGDAGDDVLRGENGDDFLAGGLGNDNLDGGLGNDRLFGASGDDILWGFDGDDELNGGTGRDQLIGEAGNDRLIGGEREDIYWFGVDPWGHDTIDNFDTAYNTGDGFVRPWDAVVFEAGITPDDISAHRDGNDLILTHTNGSTITVENQYLSFDHEISVIDFVDGPLWSFELLDYVAAPDPEAVSIENEGIGLQVSGEGVYQVTNEIASIQLSYLGATVGPQSFDGWQALHAGSNGADGYSVLWQGGGLYSIWNADASGAWVSNEVISDQDFAALIDYEDRFQFDFNGDETLGHTITDIDTVGIGLQANTRGIYQIVDGGDTFELSYLGATVGPQSFDGWQALHAGSNGADGYSVLWQGGGLYSIWNADASGAWVSNEVISDQDFAALIDYEDRFQFDFNGDG
ncbi:calcium-binding protein, partial [Roseobacter sp. EG26]